MTCHLMPLFNKVSSVLVHASLPALGSLCLSSALVPSLAAEYELKNGITVVTDESDGAFGGITTLVRDGVTLSNPKSRMVPMVTWEWGDSPWVADRMGPATIDASGDHLTITAPLLASTADTALRSTYVFVGDLEAAKQSPNLPSELKEKKQAAITAKAGLQALIDQHPAIIKQHERKAQWELSAANTSKDKKQAKQVRQAKNNLKKWPKTLAKAENNARRELLKTNSDARAYRAIIDDFKAALSPYAIEHHGSIHRDFYRFPILQQAHTISTDHRPADASYNAIGSITWHLKPVQRVIAGWTWEGVSLHVEVTMDEQYTTNVYRQSMTWEIDGDAVGNGIAALRYRGLGGAEEIFAPAAEGPGVHQAFSTTEVIPGAVGSAPLVSPIVPVSKEVNDRGFALRHRVGAWIARMARGAGANFVDWIWKDRTIVASYRERQGNFRAVTEAMPGDTLISFTDEEYFPVTNNFKTEPQLILTLQDDAAWPIHEVRTRWQEVDEYVRDVVSDEMQFKRQRALPGVGLLTDFGWEGVLNSITKKFAKLWADHGVKMMAYHNPGWINGRYQGVDGPEDTGGGVCTIYDWIPAKDLEQPWTNAYQAMRDNDIAYFPWIGQTVKNDQAFINRLGLENKEIWSLNGPNDTIGPGYAPENIKGNIYNDAFTNEFTNTLQFTRDNYGYDGFWIDSYQNLMMSQLAWGDGSGNSQQRGWWEWLAARSREDVTIMAESHSYPGLSCSIESAALTEAASPYYFKEIWRWIRGNEYSHHSDEKWGKWAFQIMANRGWLAPDVSLKHMGNMRIPGFKRYAAIYNEVREEMDRSFVLSDGRGMLWLADGAEDAGVLFAFTDQDLPDGVTASQLPDTTAADKATALHAYRVKGSNLRQAFGMRTP